MTWTARWPRSRDLVAFAPYVIVSVIDIIGSAVGEPAIAAAVKPLLMPLLAIPFLLLVGRNSMRISVVGTIALLFAWLGDIASDFIVMLAFFLCMQLAYVVLFAWPARMRRPRIWSAVYAVWWLGLVALIGPQAGALLVPVAVYGLALGAMAVFATGTNAIAAVGSAVFLVSDSVLGLAHFLPAFAFAGHDAVVMLTYTVGQLLIVAGVIRVVRMRAAAGTQPSSELTPA
ncbi:lysoplasmalogenase [Planctomonas sp. JC2975]|uniref:lysoplasmalogenase n=1 Tax=Planctomonas sp. JC2975 TaxID=2729626 RepID=UPI0014735E79|nr:lysoplasmalogenase [Planctomonas sp. JC2975]NNC13337.1 lysoplasmalogenase [Planctomonas sp. JC2975]